VEIYLVGGAVRDKRLGLPVRERDWVVIGATPEDMLKLGYVAVGKDFPVFLHPETKEEYALARTERKTGPGYTGFAVQAGPGITLEQDLMRRDLTINAMAETAEGELIDPCHGEEDLENGVLRHVSPAFSEDPVRVLRVARFAARLARLGFHVAHQTNALMRHMVDAGEVDYLVPERVCAELVRALGEDTPSRFFTVLYDCGALARLFPEIEPLYLAGEGAAHGHDDPLPALDRAARAGADPVVRFAALVGDILAAEGSAFTEDRLEGMCARLRLPNAYRELALLALRQRAAAVDTPTDLLALLEALDAFRRPERLAQFLQASEACAQAYGLPSGGARLQAALAAAQSVGTEVLQQQGISGKALGAALREARIQAIGKAL